MKESKFIELLNLYVDQEISSQDATLLEQEIAKSAERRKVYLQYCRMHRASAVLFKSFKSGQTPLGSTLADAAKRADDKVVLFPAQSQTRSWRWTYAAGLTAAAACFAFILVRNDSIQPLAPVTTETQIAIKVPQRAQPLVPKEPDTQLASSPLPTAQVAEYRPVFVTQKLNADDFIRDGQILLPSEQITFDWMKKIQLPPMVPEFEEITTFNGKPVPKQDPRTFQGPRPMQTKAEMISFEFQK